MKILIVEDNRDTVNLIRDTVRHLGWRVEDCERLERAFEMQRDFEPDAILLDLTLLDSDQRNTLAAIPRLGQRNATIVLTGHTTPEIIAEAFRHGVDDCLDKATLSDPKYFIQAIRHAYERFMRRRNLSDKQTGAVLQSLTEAERANLASYPSLRRDVDELREMMYIGDDALIKSVAVTKAALKNMDHKATLRTIVLVLFMIWNGFTNWYSATHHLEIAPLKVPDAPAIEEGK